MQDNWKSYDLSFGRNWINSHAEVRRLGLACLVACDPYWGHATVGLVLSAQSLPKKHAPSLDLCGCALQAARALGKPLVSAGQLGVESPRRMLYTGCIRVCAGFLTGQLLHTNSQHSLTQPFPTCVVLCEGVGGVWEELAGEGDPQRQVGCGSYC